jgi:hypothetical protein
MGFLPLKLYPPWKKGRRDFRRFSRPTNPEKCFLNQKKKNNFHSIFFFLFLENNILFFIFPQVLHKRSGRTSSDEGIYNCLAQQRQTSSSNSGGGAFISRNVSVRVAGEFLTNFFFFGKNFHFIPAARTNERKKTNMGFTGAPLAVASGTSVAMRSFASLSLSTQAPLLYRCNVDIK